MTFQDGLQNLIGKPVVQSKYIYGSIFHLLFAADGGEVELVCNGCQWVVLNDGGEVLLHDESVLSSEALSGVFTGLRLRSQEVLPASLSLRFDGAVFHAFMTEEYHLDIHEGVALGSPEWRQLPEAARDSFVIVSRPRKTVGWEFSAYSNLADVSWGAAYLAMQEASHGG
ncbi:hypothetical protein [Agrobacterium sp. NPDC090283]|uniref:hypothetical protein n=1 Tax=Agrobacterium sp. NPDC090283 TaxID=3363920 RepID=UPI003839D760